MIPRWISTVTWLIIIASSIALNLWLLLSGFLMQVLLVLIAIILVFSFKERSRK